VVTTTTYTYEGIQLQTLSSSTGTQTTDITYLYDENGKVMALSVAAGSPSVVYTLPVRVSDRGDIIAISDYDWNPIVSYTYGAYGSPVATQVGSSASVPLAVAQTIADLQPLRYAGYAYDSFSGLHYCSQRYYDPATMQFLSRDPALSDAEASAYQYCGGEPVGRTDPSGEAYNGAAAAAYAKKWGCSWNTRYPQFYMQLGTAWDCANFGSQCMAAGGIRQTRSWWCRKRPTSMSVSEYTKRVRRNPSAWASSRWRGAAPLEQWMRTRGWRVGGRFRISAPYVFSARPGDIIFLMNSSGTMATHTTVVTFNNWWSMTPFGTRVASHSSIPSSGHVWARITNWSGRWARLYRPGGR
jgi:RHS repeat-associated protein